MKKIILPLAVVLIIGIIAIVSATMTVINEKNDVKQYDVEIQVTKGWNLIASGFIFASDLSYLDETGDIKKENIKAVYVYADKINEYISSYPKYDERLYSTNNYFKGDEQGIIGHANWIYVDKSGTLKYKTKAIKTIDSTKLFSGWNFVSMIPDMVGKNIIDFKGTCNIEKAYGWEPDRGIWNDLLDEQLPEEATGAGFIIKVTDDCQLGNVGSGSNIPQLPQ